ncbi:hypothetical protein [Pseudomonas sp. TTU2014-080ASC]|uniref:hypothetical protein n=1 Tax=Pseudomonas sp. TTU2014-080ASC TaxID=1729724 RepID=UPI0007184959|nr:hypothetical protein [Pseudomonas sp. TTU2014-080ASC]KRW62178.1 hypothetical protein AO726_01795 [Pseudomonas sp. TTU2014-080ASC]
MNLPEVPAKASRRELRKSVLRMQLELHRQEMRHEALVMLEPLRKVQGLRSSIGSTLKAGPAPLWLTGGALLFTALGRKRRGWRQVLRLALIALPLLRRKVKS